MLEASIRSVLDLIGYESALSFDLEILSATWGANQRWVFGINVPALVESRQAHPPSAVSVDLLAAVGANPGSQYILADFREAIRVPEGTGFFCYRAIEAMMQSMKEFEGEKEETVSWPRLRETLQVSKETLYHLKRHADFPRHGKRSSISNDERTKVFRTTDNIIRRYLQYLLLGKAGLSAKDHPII